MLKADVIEEWNVDTDILRGTKSIVEMKEQADAITEQIAGTSTYQKI